MELIRAAVGDKINIFVNYLSVAFGVFVTAFVISYKLALVMSVVILLIVIELSLSTKVTDPTLPFPLSKNNALGNSDLC